MSRLEGVPARRHPLTRLIYAATRREVKKLTGKALLTPDIPIRAHRMPQLLGYAALEKSVAARPKVPERLRALAVLKSAVMQGCEMCQDIGSFEAREHGVGDAQMRDLHCYGESPEFDATERLVLDLAVAMTLTPVRVDDELVEQLRAVFDEPQIVELVHLVAVENLRSRFNAAFGLSAAGFSEGMACARMESAADHDGLTPAQAPDTPVALVS
ncbi:MAG TPA: carboxymuconolactone decarboxylase family protein [Solirubrobacteraceae bacterium]|jgi:alkylhydroperoxidase family enzyme|nr:carboxymuconolactone decarboxylase family protein [Solirubrobacteraceae bacterium]